MSDLNVAKVEALLDELIDADLDKAERFIVERLARVELRKRLQQKKEATMPTLLEKLDQIGTMAFNNELKLQELRRALAIAQAVDEVDNTGDYALAVCHEYMRYVMRRADELLKEGK